MATNLMQETIRVVPFDGKEEKDWMAWDSKTRAIGAMKSWDQTLDTKVATPTIPNHPTSTEKKAQESDKAARLYLTLACSGPPLQRILRKETAFGMYQSLREKYEPEDIDDYIDLSNTFYNCTLKEKESDPEVWFQDLDYICTRMANIDPAYNKSEIELKAFILSKLPEEYSQVVTKETKTFKTATLNQIQTSIIKFYKRKFKEDSPKDHLALSTDKKFKKPFKGSCKCCGKQGHPKRECSLRRKKCEKCGKKGHIQKLCNLNSPNDSTDEATE